MLADVSNLFEGAQLGTDDNSGDQLVLADVSSFSLVAKLELENSGRPIGSSGAQSVLADVSS